MFNFRSIATIGRSPAYYIAGISILVLNGCVGLGHFIAKENIPPVSLQPVSSSAFLAADEAVKAEITVAGQEQKRWVLSGMSDDSPIGRQPLKVQGASALDPQKAELVWKTNRLMTQYETETEPKYLQTDPNSTKLCLALSGGGLRSASFAIGILDALNQRKKLSKVSIISAVSGGGYALSWYLQERINGNSDDQVFSKEAYARIDPILLHKYLIELSLLMSPVDRLNPFLATSSSYQSNSLMIGYETMLNSSFGLETRGWFTRSTLRKIRRLVESQAIPLPILGISAFPMRESRPIDSQTNASLDGFVGSHALRDTYLEVTPLRYGIEGFGYYETPPSPINYWVDWLSISGAAIDQPHDPGGAARISNGVHLGGILRIPVALSYPVPQSSFTESEWHAQDFYATDGGFVENLAIYPLVRRRCDSILVVDAEYDPQWTFEGYRIIRDRLFSENNLILKIDAVDSMINHVKTRDRGDGVQIPADDKVAPCNTFGPDMCVARKRQKNVFLGTLDLPPISAREVSSPKQSKIIYIKLGLGGR